MPEARAGSTNLYVIPLGRRYLVYRPLSRLAFVGNAALVNALVAAEGDAADATAGPTARDTLDRLGFFAPHPRGPTEPAADAPYRPTVAVLCLTTACNLRCGYCYAAAGAGPVATLPQALGERAIERAATNAAAAGADRFSVVFHGGGEPTVAFSRLRALAEHARRCPLPAHVTVATNGVLGPAEREELLGLVDAVSLSCDGLPGVQDRQRPTTTGAGSSAAVRETLRALDRRGVPYGVRLTVTPDSVAALPASIEWLCGESACPTFQVEPVFAGGRAGTDLWPAAAERAFARAFVAAHDRAARLGRQAYYSGARPAVLTAAFCEAAERALVVTPGGELSACYEVAAPTHPLAGAFLFGRLHPDGRLDVRHDLRTRLRERLAARRRACAGCFAYWHCAGDCPAKAFVVQSARPAEAPAPGPRCAWNRAILRALLLRLSAAGGGVWRGEAMGGLPAAGAGDGAAPSAPSQGGPA